MSKCKHRDEEFTEEQMARWHSKGIRQTQCQVCHRWFWPHEWKPKPKREIIPKKPRVVRVKAALTHIPKVGAETQMVSIDLKAVKAGWIPCIILISKKYLRRKP